MATENSKKKLFAGFLGIATFVVMASCGNDSDGKTDTAMTPLVDTTAVTTDVQPIVKKKKGNASAMISADNSIKVAKDKEGVYSRAEQMPEYPGGENALSKFVESNIEYPQNAIDQNTEGTVNVSFVIDEKGKVTNPVTSGKAAGNGLDEEAIKVIKQMPAWKPGMVKGKAVKTRLMLPVTFKLDA